MATSSTSRSDRIRDFSELPGPGIIDYLRIFFFEGLRDPLKVLTRLKKDYGSTIRLNFPDFGGDLLLLSDPELMHQVLLKKQKKFGKPDTPVSNDVDVIMGKGLLTTDGEEWRRQHRILMPHFQDQSVNQMIPIAVEEADRLINRWKSDQFEQPFLLFREMKRVGLRFISRALFSHEMNQDEVREIRESIDTLRSIYRDRRTSMFTFPMWIPTPQNREALEARGRLYEFADKLIDGKRDKSNASEDMLDSMLKSRLGDGDYEMSQDELRANIVTFIIAGYTTTASAMGWMSYELMKDPAKTERVHEESVEVWNNNNPDEVLNELEYTKAAFDETLRLYPTAPWIARSSEEEIQLGNLKLPVETPVVMTPYLMHYNSEYYDKPEEFRPERFLREDSPDPLTYIPFSVGAHQCIGREIALMEGPLILSKIFSEGNFESTMATPTEATIHTAVNIEPEEDIFALFQSSSRNE